MELTVEEIELLKNCITSKVIAIDIGVDPRKQLKQSLLDLWIKLESEKRDIEFEENNLF